jgi:hypothetical protein
MEYDGRLNFAMYDYDFIPKLKLTSEVYAALNQYEKLGLHAHIVFSPRCISVQSILNLGPYDADRMLCTYIHYSLGPEFRKLQSTIRNMTQEPKLYLGHSHSMP